MTSNFTITSSLALRDTKYTIPRLGFGTYESPPGDTCYKSCLAALRAGYRHIDTAQYYANEANVGRAIRDSGIPRAKIYVTTKILFAGDDLDSTYAKVAESVRAISSGENGESGKGDGSQRGGGGDVVGAEEKSGYVDLFLVHSPNGGRDKRELMWRALERGKKAGLIRAIGVSNYGAAQIEEIKEYGESWPPSVNQIELHPWCQQRHCTSYCAKNNIIVEAYCPVVRNQKASDTTITSLSKKYDKTPSQVLIRWALERGFVPLPKSDTPSRIEENAGVFGWSLEDEDVRLMDGLDQGRAGSIVQAVPEE